MPDKTIETGAYENRTLPHYSYGGSPIFAERPIAA
jgi:hypothetical protein